MITNNDNGNWFETTEGASWYELQLAADFTVTRKEAVRRIGEQKVAKAERLRIKEFKAASLIWVSAEEQRDTAKRWGDSPCSPDSPDASVN